MNQTAYNLAQILINEAKSQIAPAQQDYTSGAGGAPSSPGLPISFTTPNDDGKPVSEAFYDLDNWDSDTAVWS